MNVPAAEAARAETAVALRGLLAQFDAGEHTAFDAGLRDWMRHQEDALFGRIARLTRELHEAMAEVRLDARLARLAGDEIPDARARLDHVIKLTEQAAHRTLDLVDDARKVAGQVEGEARRLAELGAAGGPLVPVVEALRQQAGSLRHTLSELAMAQEYQDLAGQMIKRVISLVINVESALLGALSSEDLARAAAEGPATPDADELLGPTLPGQVAANQQDADDLLADLGF